MAEVHGQSLHYQRIDQLKCLACLSPWYPKGLQIFAIALNCISALAVELQKNYTLAARAQSLLHELTC